MTKQLVYVGIFAVLSGGVGGYIIATRDNSCAQLLALKKAEQAERDAARERERKFWSNNDKPIPFPKFEDRGL